jgi:hypothetical protein
MANCVHGTLTRKDRLLSFNSTSYTGLASGSSQIPWLQIQRSGFDSRRYQIFREVVGGFIGTQSDTNLVPAASPICGVKTKHPRVNPTDTYKDELFLSDPTECLPFQT